MSHRYTNYFFITLSLCAINFGWAGYKVLVQNINSIIPIDVATDVAGTPIALGSNLSGLTITPDLSTSYSTDFSSKVYAIDVLTETIVATITVGGSFDFAVTTYISPDGTKAYTILAGGSQLTPIDITTNTAGTPFNPKFLSFGIADLTFSPDSATAYALMSVDKIVIPITVSTNTPGTEQSLGLGTVTTPNTIVATASEVLVTNQNSNNLSRFSVPLAATATLSSVGMGPTTITVTGGFAYVLNTGGGTVSKIDLSTGMEVGSALAVGTSPNSIAITPLGDRAYVTNKGTDNVSVIDLTSFTVTQTIAVGDGPTKIAITPDGTKAYVLNETSSNVTPITLADNTPQTAISVGAMPRFLVIGLGADEILPPTNLVGLQKRNDAGFQYSLFNVLNWNGSLAGDLTGYAIYRNNAPLATVGPEVDTYTDLGIEKGVTTVYSVIALTVSGDSAPITVSVP